MSSPCMHVLSTRLSRDTRPQTFQIKKQAKTLHQLPRLLYRRVTLGTQIDKKSIKINTLFL